MDTAETGILLQQKKRGRPQSPDKLYFNSVGLRQQQWDWLKKWHSGSTTDQMAELFAWAMKFWPNGPLGQLHCEKCGRFISKNNTGCACQTKP